ncbi:MAG: virulence RhuM family protein [Patescibacteria group bacterium]|nr:virulence RhuM family protein [Patescibacteria group bacterium]
MNKQDKKNQIIIYNTEDGEIKIEAQIKDETVWLSQAQLVELFQSSKANISEHIKHIFKEGELRRNSVVRNFRTTAKDEKNYDIEHYNLDLIISLGYRVKSQIATQFRIWATQKLKEYIIKGFTMDDERLKENGGGNYWKELFDRIRDIRSSEKALYRQVLDLYATSIDYNPNSQESIKFFKVVQNKLHYATNKQTAAETIHARVDAEKDFMGLTTFAGALPIHSEISIAKNYLTEDELFRLNRMVSAFFDLAEIKAKEKQKMYMADWVVELDKFSENYGQGVLQNAGKVSYKQSAEKATKEYKKFQAKTLSPVEKSYLENIKLLEKEVEKKIKS